MSYLSATGLFFAYILLVRQPLRELCEYPWVKFEYDDQGTVIRIAGYELKGDPWVRWTSETKPKSTVLRRRAR